MKKDERAKVEKEMLDEYDFAKGEQGKYSERYAERTNLVRLAPERSFAHIPE